MYIYLYIDRMESIWKTYLILMEIYQIIREPTLYENNLICVQIPTELFGIHVHAWLRMQFRLCS